jgi:asparagine synthetase B (glutamine-hydrolysing)
VRSLLRFRDERTSTSSTELRDLAPGKRLDVGTLAAYLCQDAPIPSTRTLYEGVTNEYVPDVWRASPDPAPDAHERAPRDLREACARVTATLEHVIERTVGDARRVAVLASGGIDSSVVMALVTELMARRNGTAFAIAIDFASAGDDRPHLRALEAHLKCEVIRISPADGAQHLTPVREGLDAAPMLWPYSPVQLALFAVARKHGAERVLTGIGGDDFFDGDPRGLAELVKRHPLQAIERARSLDGFDAPRSPVLEYLVRPLLVPFVPARFRRFRARRARRPHLTAPWAGPKLREVSRALADRSLEDTLATPKRKTLLASFGLPGYRYFAWLVHQEQRGGKVDRYDPLLTEEVAATVATIPPHLVLAGDRRRGLLRESMRGRLPDSLLDRPDKAEFAPAFPPLLEAVGGVRAFAEELEGRALGRLGIVDPSVFGREITRALETSAQNGQYGLAWAALAAESFLSRHPELA